MMKQGNGTNSHVNMTAAKGERSSSSLKRSSNGTEEEEMDEMMLAKIVETRLRNSSSVEEQQQQNQQKNGNDSPTAANAAKSAAEKEIPGREANVRAAPTRMDSLTKIVETRLRHSDLVDEKQEGCDSVDVEKSEVTSSAEKEALKTTSNSTSISSNAATAAKPGAYLGAPGRAATRTSDLRYSSLQRDSELSMNMIRRTPPSVGLSSSCSNFGMMKATTDHPPESDVEAAVSSSSTTKLKSMSDLSTTMRMDYSDEMFEIAEDIVATPIDDDTDDVVQYARPSFSSGKDGENNKGRRRGCIMVASMFLLVLGLFVGIYAGLSSSKAQDSNKDTIPTPTMNPTMNPTMAPTANILGGEGLVLPHATKIALQDPDSPQSKAYQWLLDDPNLYTYPLWRRIQRFAMVTFFLSTNGPNWKRNDYWLDYDKHECTWTQVGGWNSTLYSDGDIFVMGFMKVVLDFYKTGNMNYGMFSGDEEKSDCDDEGQLQILRLSNNDLDGVVPPQIGFLTSLREMIFFQNNLVGTIPTSVGLLTDLDILQFSNNFEMTGPIPTEIGLLTNVRSFSLAYMSNLDGTIPSEIGFMTSMFGFHIPKTSVTGPLPSEIGELQDLRLIHTEETKLSGKVPSEIFRLTNLRYLQGAESLFRSSSFPSSQIHKLSNLEYINLDGNGMTGMLPTQLGTLTKLLFLSLHDNDFTGAVPSHVGLLSDLEFLKLHSNDFSGQLPSELGLLSNLFQLTLYDNPSLIGTIPDQVCAAVSTIDEGVNCSTASSTNHLCGCGQCNCSSSSSP